MEVCRKSIAFAVITLTCLFVFGSCAPKASKAVLPGQPAPSLELEGFGGTRFSLAAPRANALVLLFAERKDMPLAQDWITRIKGLTANFQYQIIVHRSSNGAQYGRRPQGGFGGGFERPEGGGGRPRRGEGGEPGRPDRPMENVLFDRTGDVTKKWVGEDISGVVVVVVSQHNVVSAIVRGPATQENMFSVANAITTPEHKTESEQER